MNDDRWAKGDLILNTYEVKEIHEGGRGLVYRVFHHGWGIDLALKSPQAELLRTDNDKTAFIQECKSWIQLGLHPSVVTCFYVRSVDGLPRIFSEYVEGGTLSQWIKEQRTYQGPQEASMARILVLAVEMAAGLYHAHNNHLIHQDVKPGNVLMSSGGAAKLTDFGLATARTALVESGEDRPAPLLTRQGMTPAYCSPEQVERSQVSYLTDVWSWGLSVLEMFAGEPFWAFTAPHLNTGQLALEALEYFQSNGSPYTQIPRMPERMFVLLRRCFAHDPARRPQSMYALIEEVKEIYSDELARPCPHKDFQGAPVASDNLNNEAISKIDLGQREIGKRQLAQVVEKDPHHLEASYNRGLILWREGKIGDIELIAQLKEIRTTHQQDWRPDYFLSQVHNERSDIDAAALSVESAKAKFGSSGMPAWNLRLLVEKQLDGHALIKTMEEHGRKPFKQSVDGLAISPAGDEFVALSSGSALRLWNLPLGLCVRVIKIDEWQNVLSYMPSGRQILTGGMDGSLRLWELDSLKCVLELGDASDEIIAVAIDRRGRLVLTGTRSGPMCLWDIKERKLVRSIGRENSASYSISFGPDSAWFVEAGGDELIRRWNLNSGECEQRLIGHTETVVAVATSADGTFALSGGWDRTLRMWDLKTGTCMARLQGHSGHIIALALSPNGHWAASIAGDYDFTVRLWDLKEKRCIRTFEFHKAKPTSVAFHTSSRYLLSSDREGAINLHKIGSSGPRARHALAVPSTPERLTKEERVRNSFIMKARKSLKESKLSRAMSEIEKAPQIPGDERHPEILIVRRQIGARCKKIDLRGAWCRETLHEAEVLSIALAPNERPCLITAQGDETIRVRDQLTGDLIHTFPAEGISANVLGLSPDGRLIATALYDGTFVTRDSESGEELRRFEGHGKRVNTLSFSPDGRLILSGGNDRSLRLWEAGSGKLILALHGHGGAVNAAAISPDGSQILSGGDSCILKTIDNTLLLWDLGTGELIREMAGHPFDPLGPEGGVTNLVFSPNDDLALTGGYEKMIRLWNLSTGSCIKVFEGHEFGTKCLSFLPDGGWALSAGADKIIKVWDIKNMRFVRGLEGHTGPVKCLASSSDGHWIASADADNCLCIWELDWIYDCLESEQSPPQGIERH